MAEDRSILFSLKQDQTRPNFTLVPYEKQCKTQNVNSGYTCTEEKGHAPPHLCCSSVNGSLYMDPWVTDDPKVEKEMTEDHKQSLKKRLEEARAAFFVLNHSNKFLVDKQEMVEMLKFSCSKCRLDLIILFDHHPPMGKGNYYGSSLNFYCK